MKHFSYPKAFFEYSYYMDDIYKNTKEYNPDKKQKILTVFDDMIPHIYSNKRLNPLATELFVREWELNISLVFITKYYFTVPKHIRLNSTHYFIMKIPNKRELQKIAFDHSSDKDFQDFMSLSKNVLQNHIHFYCLILLLHQIILYILERI